MKWAGREVAWFSLTQWGRDLQLRSEVVGRRGAAPRAGGPDRGRGGRIGRSPLARLCAAAAACVLELAPLIPTGYCVNEEAQTIFVNAADAAVAYRLLVPGRCPEFIERRGYLQSLIN
jgi:hypothetical protein